MDFEIRIGLERLCDFKKKRLTLRNLFFHLLCGRGCRGCWGCWGSNPRSYNSCQLGKIALASTPSLLKLSQVRQTLDPAEKQIFFLCEYIFRVRWVVEFFYFGGVKTS